MDIRSIKTFQTIVKYGSFNKAASELKYAQSTITTHIKKLESDLGTKLFEREKGLHLTQAGKLLNRKGDLLLKDFENLQEAMSELINGESGMIRIGAMEPTASYRIPNLLKPFIKAFPKIQVSIQIENSKTLSKMVKSDEIDLAICTAPDLSSGMHFTPLFSESIALLIPENEQLGGQETITLKDIENEEILITTAVCPFRRNLEKQMIDKGIRPNYQMEISHMPALKFYAQAGFGIAAVPLITVTPPPEGTVVREISDFRKALTVGMLRNEERSYTGKAMESLIQLLTENLATEKLE
ncbi:LysR family transcriptional regulator [Bacillus gobiensis]|uniref:LysR family transcriptional regulator n=1 Tax=Bacillus gobiensis TaxID=1441095 RepID=UPI003D24E906